MLIIPLSELDLSIFIFPFLNLGREEYESLVQSINNPLSINLSTAAGFE